MEGEGEMKVSHISNAGRKSFEFVIDKTLSPEKIIIFLDEQFRNLGYPEIGDRCVCIKMKSGESVTIDQADLYSEQVEELIYSRFVKMDNAYEYAHEDGISYYFNTNEGNHIHYPHIHARLGGREEISIYFKDLRIVGKTRNFRKAHQAREWVAAHIVELKEEWNRILAVQ